MTAKDEVVAKRQALEQAFGQLWECYDQASLVLQGTTLVDAPRNVQVMDFSPLTEALVPEPMAPAGSDISLCNLKQLQQHAKQCEACDLCKTRRHVVFGDGKIMARLMVIGGGPGAADDNSGLPFDGEVGQYLDKWLFALGLSRESNVYVSNVIKCRPVNSQSLTEEKLQACLPYLRREVALVKPDAILCVGPVAANALLNMDATLDSLRGNLYRFDSIPLVVTHHPAMVMRDPQLRGGTWSDLQRLAKILGIPLPERK